AEAFAGGGLLRELDNLDGPFAGQALEQQVRQAESHAQSLGQGPLAQGTALTDGSEDLEIALGLSLHARWSGGTASVHQLNVQYLNMRLAGLSSKTSAPPS